MNLKGVAIMEEKKLYVITYGDGDEGDEVSVIGIVDEDKIKELDGWFGRETNIFYEEYKVNDVDLVNVYVAKGSVTPFINQPGKYTVDVTVKKELVKISDPVGKITPYVLISTSMEEITAFKTEVVTLIKKELLEMAEKGKRPDFHPAMTFCGHFERPSVSREELENDYGPILDLSMPVMKRNLKGGNE